MSLYKLTKEKRSLLPLNKPFKSSTHPTVPLENIHYTECVDSSVKEVLKNLRK